MPTGRGKGGKNRKKGKRMEAGEKRELIFKEDGQDYGQVLRLLGAGRLEAYCFDGGMKRLCHIRGKIKNRVWMQVGDIILVSLREFEDGKGDVIHKYFDTEAKELIELGEIPDNVKINEDDFDDEYQEENNLDDDDDEEEKKEDVDIDAI